MNRALGAYRSNDAAAIAALMLVLTILAFALLPPLFERLARARAS
jgi:thiamine transport system permease protein